jgi:transposase
MDVYLHYRPKEIDCPTHGRIQEEIPWADTYFRITYRLEYLVVRFAQIMTQKEAAGLLGMPPSTFSDILHRTITQLRDGHRIRDLKSIGIDEISYRKGMKYATLVYDLDRGCVVWVGKGKEKETIESFFTEQLSPYQKERILWASCDMSETYMGAIKKHCPNATLVLDRFHIVKALNGAMDEVRKEEWRVASKLEREALKGLRWLLFKHSSNRSKKETRGLNALRKGNRRIHRAWVLKDEFEQIWEYVSIGAAERFLKNWITSVLRSRLEPLKKYARTLRKHFAHVIAYVRRRLTNAVAEGLNRVIKMVKNRASGFRTLEGFADMIYLTVGDLDLPAQINRRFRTI